jgi:glutamate--cysteine ligase
MSLDSQVPERRPLTQVQELVEYFKAAERRDQLLVGLEHEKLIFEQGRTEPVAYAPTPGIGALMEGFASFGFSKVRERDDLPVIAMTRGPETLSLEPGGQFELSGSPFATVQAGLAENQAHVNALRQIASPLGLRAVGLGYRPYASLDAMPWMPKRRYGVMRHSLGARGAMAHRMMLMTATAQVSLDWTSEVDCARKMTVSARATPIVVALFANSPIVEGRTSDYLTFRSHVWGDVDAARCGYFPQMLSGQFTYADYVNWALDAPLLFLRRNDEYLTPSMTFRQLLRDGFEGKPAHFGDWVDHTSTLFPEVRLKKILEIRAADSGSVAMSGALGALMRGLLYVDASLDAALALLPPQSFDTHRNWHAAVQKQALDAEAYGRKTGHLARELLAIARQGLRTLGDGDEALLAPLDHIVERGTPNAALVLEAFSRGGDWLSQFEL